VAAGEVLISVASRDRLSRQHRAIATTAGRNARDLDQLTQREKEVLGCVCAGWENQDIAGELGISLTTVSWHVRNILGKLGVRSKWEASIRAAALGFRGVEVRAEG